MKKRNPAIPVPSADALADDRFVAPSELRRIALPVQDTVVPAIVDRYSDRLRCDHPGTVGVEALGDALVSAAEARDCGRIVVLAPPEVQDPLAAEGFTTEAVMPGFYRGEADCAVMGLALDPTRADLANPIEVAHVETLLEKRGDQPPRPRPDVETTRATVDDADAIATLIDATFAAYPTPSHDPAYIAEAIADGVPFRTVRDGGEVVACASADLVREAQTAELTDCATRPDHRGRGLMQAILTDLMDDLRALGYPTAFTLARARIPGVNLAFERLGFVHRGVMPSSCRIGGGLEDMNVWSRRLLPVAC